MSEIILRQFVRAQVQSIYFTSVFYTEVPPAVTHITPPILLIHMGQVGRSISLHDKLLLAVLINCGQGNRLIRHREAQNREFLVHQVNDFARPITERYCCVRTGFFCLPARKILTIRNIGLYRDMSATFNPVTESVFECTANYRQRIASISRFCSNAQIIPRHGQSISTLCIIIRHNCFKSIRINRPSTKYFFRIVDLRFDLNGYAFFILTSRRRRTVIFYDHGIVQRQRMLYLTRIRGTDLVQHKFLVLLLHYELLETLAVFAYRQTAISRLTVDIGNRFLVATRNFHFDFRFADNIHFCTEHDSFDSAQCRTNCFATACFQHMNFLFSAWRKIKYSLVNLAAVAIRHFTVPVIRANDCIFNRCTSIIGQSLAANKRHVFHRTVVRHIAIVNITVPYRTIVRQGRIPGIAVALCMKFRPINHAMVFDRSRKEYPSFNCCFLSNLQLTLEITAITAQVKSFFFRRVQRQRLAVIRPAVAIVNGLAISGLLLCVFLTGIRHTIRKNQFRVKCHRRCGYRKRQRCPADFVWVQGKASIRLQHYAIPICKRIGVTAIRNIPVGNAIARYFERIRVIGYHIHRLAQVNFFSIGGINKLRRLTSGRQRITIRNCSTTGRFCYKHTTGDRCTSGLVLDFCLKQATRNACRYSFIAGIAIRHIILKHTASDFSSVIIDYTRAFRINTDKNATGNGAFIRNSFLKGSA